MSWRILACLLLLMTLSPIPVGSDEIWFGDAINTALPETPIDIALGYLNNDDILDVAYYSDEGWIHILFGDGTGRFALNESYPAGAGYYAGLDIGDLNSDGAPDIASVDGYNNFCRVRYNDGSGGFSGSEDQIPGRGWLVRIGDLDGDMINDLVTLRIGVIFVHWGTESGPSADYDEYYPLLSPNPECLSNELWDCQLVDLTGDSLRDIVVIANEVNLDPDFCGPDERGLGLLRNLGGREFQIEWLHREPLGEEWSDFDVGDLDNDEDLDVAISQMGGNLRTFLNIGDGQLIEGTELGSYAMEYVALEDFNLDDDVDIAWSRHTIHMKVWAGDGADHFTFIQLLDHPLRYVEAGQLNGHPGPELIGSGDNVLTVFPNLTYLDPSSVDEPQVLVDATLRVEPTVLDAGGCIIRLSLGSDSVEPTVEILDVLGRRCATLRLWSAGAGSYSTRWDGTDDHGRSLPSGVYWIRACGIADRAAAKVLVLR